MKSMRSEKNLKGEDRKAPVIGIPSRFVRISEFKIDCHGVRSPYVDSVISAGGIPLIIPIASLNESLARRYVGMCDGFLFAGGEDVHPRLYGETAEPLTTTTCIQRDELELGLLHEITKNGRPVLGICRGLQIINVARGGTLCQDIPTHLRSSVCHSSGNGDWTEISHQVEIVGGSILSSILGDTPRSVNSLHHQCVKKLGQGLQICARAVGDDVIEGVESTGDAPWLLAVQWHPETLWQMTEAEGAGLSWNLDLFKALVRACHT